MRFRTVNECELGDKQAHAYLQHYCQQVGGSFPVFRGQPYQTGAGLGDILRAVGRWVLPIFAPMASRFISSTADGMREGHTLKDSAKSAIVPSLSTGIDAAGSELKRRMKGSGKRKSQRRINRRKRTRRIQSIGTKRQKLYKAKPKRKSKSLVHRRKRVRFISNF